jgi:hypothetical protein
LNFYNNSSNEALSDVAKANIEALAIEHLTYNDGSGDLIGDGDGAKREVYCHAGGANSTGCNIAAGTSIGAFGAVYATSTGCGTNCSTNGNVFSCCTLRCSCLTYSAYRIAAMATIQNIQW